jgi:hypothetical protein
MLNAAPRLIRSASTIIRRDGFAPDAPYLPPGFIKNDG